MGREKLARLFEAAYLSDKRISPSELNEDIRAAKKLSSVISAGVDGANVCYVVNGMTTMSNLYGLESAAMLLEQVSQPNAWTNLYSVLGAFGVALDTPVDKTVVEFIARNQHYEKIFGNVQRRR